MKPSAHDKRLRKLTLEQYLGLADGMSFKIAGRMLTLAGDYTNDVVRMYQDGLGLPNDAEALNRIARSATRTEANLGQLLGLAALHCADSTLGDVPHAIRSNTKIVARCRSAICLMAIAAMQEDRHQQLDRDQQSTEGGSDTFQRRERAQSARAAQPLNEHHETMPSRTRRQP